MCAGNKIERAFLNKIDHPRRKTSFHLPPLNQLTSISIISRIIQESSVLVNSLSHAVCARCYQYLSSLALAFFSLS
jgi:hypothetical protein